MICPHCENPFTAFAEEVELIRDWKRIRLRCPDLEGCGAYLGYRDVDSHGEETHLAYPPEMFEGKAKFDKRVYMPEPKGRDELPRPSYDCPFCMGEADHLQTDEGDDEVEDAYVCETCRRIVVYVYDRETWDRIEGFHEAAPEAVFWEWGI